MRISFLLFLCLFLGSVSSLYAEKKEVKVKGINYTIDFSSNTAAVGKNYNKRLKCKLKGDIVLPDRIIYKRKSYPVVEIENIAFLGSKELTSIYIPASVVKLGKIAFAHMSGLKNIYVASDNPVFQSIDGVLFNKTGSKIFRYPSAHAGVSYALPSSVKIINAGCFQYCNRLKQIFLPEKLSEIGEESFYGCEELKSIEIPDGVKFIGKETFGSCCKLESVLLPESVQTVDEDAFSLCFDLNLVVYQNKNISFAPKAFDGCLDLKKERIVYETPVKSYLELGEKGKAEYQFKLAECYRTGEGVEQNWEAAVDWYKKAGIQGYVPAQLQLGRLYYNGIGVKKDGKQAFDWFSKAAQQGSIGGLNCIADCYNHGVGVQRDTKSALKWYKAAADANSAYAQEVLGYFYYNGYENIISQDYKKAVKWFTLAAEKGMGNAQYQLGICYNEGTGVAKNSDLAIEWLEKSFDNGVKSGEKLYCILAYNDAVDKMNNYYYHSAISRFTSLMKYDKKNANAYINRGYCYLNKTDKDYIAAKKDFEKALEIEPDNLIAKNNMNIINEYYRQKEQARKLSNEGDRYYERRDYVNAVSCYAQSVSLDNTQAYPYYSIGYCYYDCSLYAEAITYFNKALEVDPSYSAARKAVKSARTQGVLQAISQSLAAVSNALNGAVNNVTTSGGLPSSYTAYSTSSLNKVNSTKRSIPCSLCHGTGKNPTKERPAFYSYNEETYSNSPCSVCGDRSNHYHKDCPSCGGKGELLK